ncbi:MAG: hypothetical protein K2X27_16885, partial [Candidatus Obscuribacterales bacterium]|nr:hypothetical protein [Candidatus Obscuribacterales bacterium]
NLSDAEILEVISGKTKVQRGFRFDAETAFLVLRIPAQSSYKSETAISKLRDLFKSIDLNPRHYQIDEDWYLYFFLSDFAPASELRALFSRWCAVQGVEFGPDCLELYPQDKALPFPLQSNFTWMNERCQLLVRRSELGLADALGFFLEDAFKNAPTPSLLIETLTALLPPEELKPEEPAEMLVLPELTEQNFDFDSLDAAADFEKTEEASLPDNVISISFAESKRVLDLDSESESAQEAKDSELPAAPLLKEPEDSDSGSRLVVFADEQKWSADSEPEMLSSIDDDEGSQLLLFPVARQAVLPEESEDLEKQSGQPKRKKEARLKKQED